jgi:hypothetical protein
MDHWGDYWRFTTLSARMLFTEFFPENCVMVKAHGNALAAVALLQRLVVEELLPNELEYFDRDYEVIICVRVTKPEQKE